MLSVTGWSRVPAPPANTMPLRAISERAYGCHGDRHVVDDRRHSGPERQRRQTFRIERHDDRIARLHLQIRSRRLEPAMTLRGHHAAVRMDDIDFAAISPLRYATAQPDVVIP